MDKVSDFIFRIVSTRTPKSVSLHKNGDYQTGLSFYDYNPGGQTLVFRVSRLIEQGYTIQRDGGLPMVNIWTQEPYIEPNAGVQLSFPPNHVSVWYNNHEYWYQWHLADKANYTSATISLKLQTFFDLREQ